MSIEFGILREGSTITLLGEYRVVLSDIQYFTLDPMFRRIGSLTGQEMECWESAEFVGSGLRVFINEVLNELHSTTHGENREVLLELLRVALHADHFGKQLSFLGD